MKNYYALQIKVNFFFKYLLKMLMTILAFVCNINLFSQVSIEWEKSFGTSNAETPKQIIQTNDGGYIVIGYHESFAANSNHQYWIIKLNASGNKEWENYFGGSLNEDPSSIIQTNDGGYLLAGTSKSNDIDVSNNFGYNDVWLVKVSSNGVLEWEKNYGGTQNEYESVKIITTNDNNYLVGSTTYSNDTNVTLNQGLSDYWIFKIDTTGNLLWEQTYGGSDEDLFSDVIQTSDGGYLLAGTTNSSDGDISSFNGSSDYWLVKTNHLGELLWESNYGGLNYDVCKTVKETNNGYVIGGHSLSNDNFVSNNNGNEDFWIVKTDLNGEIEWEQALGGSDEDLLEDMIVLSDNNILLGGASLSSNGDLSNNYGSYDYWLVKLNNLGDTLWQKTFGGTSSDYMNSLIQSNDNAYVLAGGSLSNDINISENNGDWDLWILKLSAENDITTSGKIEFLSEKRLDIFPNPTKDILTITSESTIGDVNIFNSLGILIQKYSLNSKHETLDLSSYLNGLYYIHFSNSEIKVFIKN